MYDAPTEARYAHLPWTITHQGRTYHRTGKLGTSITTNVLVVEMSDASGDLIWVAADGTTFPG